MESRAKLSRADGTSTTIEHVVYETDETFVGQVKQVSEC